MPGLLELIREWIFGYPARPARLLSMVGIEVHWLILQYVLGLPLLAVVAEAVWMRSGDERWKRLSRTLTKGFVAVFAVGAATGTAAEFGLILLWPNLIELAGRYIYFPLYMEIFAFIMECVFVYLYFFAEGRLSRRAHLLVGVLVVLGAWYSASMILSVNSFMQSPTIVAANYDPLTGSWAPPEVILQVPSQIAQALDVDKLAASGAQVLGTHGDRVAISFPAGLVRALVAVAFAGRTVNESVLVAIARPEAAQILAEVPLKKIIDPMLETTVLSAGVYAIAFKSGGYLATLLHAIGAGVTVSAFTTMGAYSLRLLTCREGDPDKGYYSLALRYATTVSLIAILIQGLGFGHAMGVAVARHNPEKIAAMEGTGSQITSVPQLIGLDGLIHRRLIPLLAYGSTRAKIPSYDAINPAYRPPLIIHYMYYAKLGLAALMGLAALGMARHTLRREVPPTWLLKLSSVSPAIAQATSFLGWGVREAGRKPWAIYGVMDVQTELTMNPPPAWQLAGVAIYLALMLALLCLVVHRYVWRR